MYTDSNIEYAQDWLKVVRPACQKFGFKAEAANNLRAEDALFSTYRLTRENCVMRLELSLHFFETKLHRDDAIFVLASRLTTDLINPECGKTIRIAEWQSPKLNSETSSDRACRAARA
ncbi:MAG: hypothetical protein ACYDC6_04400 [Acidobacteriaceae bacterium]